MFGEVERAMLAAAILSGEPVAAEMGVEAGGSAERPWTVGQVNGFLNQTLPERFPHSVFFIQGEISNYRTYDRGHAFFTLKDAGAELPCILWKDGLSRLKFKPKDGHGGHRPGGGAAV